MVKFPAVTVCNQNPIKRDQLIKGDLLNEIILDMNHSLTNGGYDIDLAGTQIIQLT